MRLFKKKIGAYEAHVATAFLKIESLINKAKSSI